MNRLVIKWIPVAVLFLPLAGCGDDPTDEPADHSWTLLGDEVGGTPLAAGEYGLTADGASDTVVVVTAPEGFMNSSGSSFVTGPPFHAVGYQTVEKVYGDPCGLARDDKTGTIRDPGPTVADLAEALVAQLGTKTTAPVPVTVDGHEGLYLDYEVAEGVVPDECQNQAFDIFSRASGPWNLEAARERAGIWIMDVDGERLVLTWVAVPGVTEAKIQEMAHMVETARFVEAG